MMKIIYVIFLLIGDRDALGGSTVQALGSVLGFHNIGPHLCCREVVQRLQRGYELLEESSMIRNFSYVVPSSLRTLRSDWSRNVTPGPEATGKQSVLFRKFKIGIHYLVQLLLP